MELTQYLSGLTSLSATGPDQRKALENLQRAVLEATDTSSKQARWQASQDQLHLNAATAVLEFVARVAYRFQLIDTLDFPTLAAALKLLQGLLLLHRPSAALFSRPSTLESMLALLANPKASPLTSQSPKPGSQEAELPLLVLDTILCGLADQPDNIRAFEQVGGVAEVVKLLRSKQIGKAIRMKCLEMIHFYLLPEGTHVVSASTATTARTPPTPGTPRRHRYRSESLRAVLERVEDEWIPRTPRKTTSVSHEARPTPIPLSDSNPGLGISQSEKGTPSKPAMSPLSTPVSKPKGHRHSASASSSRTAASENPFAPTTSTHRKTGQHDLAFFSAMANSASQSSSKKRPSPQKETPQDTFGPVKRSGVAASPRRPLRSPLKRSLTSSPKSREPTSRPSSSPRKTSMTPRQNHPIVPLPSRRRSVVQQEQQPPQSPLTRSQTDPDLVSTPKNSTLSRSTSEESPLSDILNGVRHPTDSPSHLGTQKYEDPDLRRRASLQLSQSRSALRHSLGLISNSNTSTPAAAPRAPARAPDRDDRSSTASTQSTTDNASSPVRSHVSNVKKAVPSPISRSKTDAKSRLSASYQSMSSPAESQVKSVDEKKQLLSRHLGDVDGLMRRFDAIGVR